MGYHATKHDEFTTSDPVNKAILGLSIIRFILFFFIFLLNLNQTIQEVYIAKKKKKYFTNARLLTFISITVYPLSRLGMIGAFFYDKTIDNGSITVAISIWGTLFQYFEWLFIACYFLSLLYTFFINKGMVLQNTKRAWFWSWCLVGVLVAWTIFQTVLNFYYVDLMNSTYGYGQMIICCGIGSFYLINGIILAKAMKKNGSPQLKESYNRVVKICITLLILVVVIFLVYIIQYPVLGLEDYDTANYAFYIVLCLLEYMQLSTVMYSLGGGSYRKYFKLFNLDEIGNSSKANSSNNTSNKDIVSNTEPYEINLNISSNGHKEKDNKDNNNLTNTATTFKSSSSISSNINNSTSTFNNISTSSFNNTSNSNFNNFNNSTSTLNLSVSIDINNSNNNNNSNNINESMDLN